MRIATRSWSAVLLALVLFSPPRAETAPWTAIGPFGGTVHSLAVSTRDPRVLYAGTEGGGVYRSANGGRTWEARNEGLSHPGLIHPIVLALAIDPRDPDTVFAGTRNGLFASVDGGASWSGPHQDLGCSLGTCNEVVALLIDPARPRTLYAVANARVYQSVDGGASWRDRSARLPALAAVTALALDPKAPRTLYAGTFRRGIHKSTNGGATWFPASGGFRDENVTAITVDPRSPCTVYVGTDELGGSNLWKSADGGATWRVANTGLRGAAQRVLALAVDPAAPQTLYAGTRGGLFWTTDGARSWRPRSGGQLAPFGVSALAVHPTAPAVLWAGTGMSDRPGAGVFRTQNRGASWAPARQGMSATDVRSLALAPPASPSAALYAGTGGLGIFRRPDRGGHWTVSSHGLPGGNVGPLLAHPENPSILYAGTDAGVFRSADGGATWASRNQGLSPGPSGFTIQSLAFQPGNPDVLYASTLGGFYKSTDAGASWRAVSLEALAWSIAVSPADPAVVYIAGIHLGADQNPKLLCRSDDAGETLGLCAETFALWVATDPRDAGVVLFGTPGDGLHRSTDGGASFPETAFAGSLVSAFLFDRFAPGTAYAAVRDGRTGETALARSRDGGATWEILPGGGLGTVWVHTLAVDAAGTLYAGTMQQGILRYAGAR